MTALPIPDEQAALAALLRQQQAEGGTESLSTETLGQYICFCKLRGFCADKSAESCLRERNLYQAFVDAGR
ncbi:MULTISPECIES: hypothetical protein [Methylovorus]|uniref:Uncharacterized protein n=1 Tax=Methylovorus glucosotrophus (strain SIP3-4) TaxID=582744 RepID=C6XBJ0_METGS|nr:MULTISPECIES: hypothetical protein [Methylovorus]ACT51960.1 hypothetical protein Msip34_2723 [Methylovorus glucosotrophus SIP3-4]ADQ85804.1 conserved hypothetical protein [Methylovorus sp. MP688]KAF0842762.1 hypothetical protein FNL37_0174 [Methylovorus glucosotrophus]